jgi:Tol biopolymer transport system component
VANVRNDELSTTAFVKLNSPSVLNLSPSLLPDGKSVAYSATNSLGLEPEEIYLRAVDGLAPVCLTCDVPGRKVHPAFSPVGTRIAFASNVGEDGIIVMGRDGSSPRRLTSRGYHPAWSPDASEIAYSTLLTDISDGRDNSCSSIRPRGGWP